MYSDCTCCSKIEDKHQTILCPNCKSEGKIIEEKTIKSQLDISLLELKSDQYWFCSNPNCYIVYFTDMDSEIYKESDLRELVYQKHINEKDVLVCYCFKYTVGEIIKDYLINNESLLLEEIKRGTKSGKCACDIRNPQGSCCIGNIVSIIKKIQ